VASNPSLDVVLTPLGGEARPLEEWLTTFNLACVVLDPYTNESSWILPTASRVIQTFEQADCRVALLVTAGAADCRRFLGPMADTVLTFADPDRVAVKGFGLSRLPAIIHVAMDGTIVNAAEGWHPAQWRTVTDALAKKMSWSAPAIPTAADPGPFEGSPALA
jgi:hypothetical protein